MAINLLKSFLAFLNLRPLGSVDIREKMTLYEAGSRESDASARSFIVSVTQPVSHSFSCHVSCKVKYFGNVANVKVRI